MINEITAKSTLEEAYSAQESVSVWSTNSKKAYRRNIKLIAEHIKCVGLEPIIENVTYDYGKRWLVDHYGTCQPSTLNQRKSTIPSLFSHSNIEGIITGNPFLNLEIEDYSAESHLSKDLNLVELYQCTKQLMNYNLKELMF